MVKNPIQLLQSGMSKRWHNNADMCNCADDLSQHQWSVAMIVMYLEPNFTKRLLVEALTHDVGEVIAGDLSYDFKINNPEVAKLHKIAEEKAKDKIFVGERLTNREVDVLKFSDWISSLWWVALHKPALLSRHDWTEQTNHFLKGCEKKSFHMRAKFLIGEALKMAEQGTTHKIDLNWKFNKDLEEYKTA